MSKQTSTFFSKGHPSIRNYMDLILVTVNQSWSCKHTPQLFQLIFMSQSDLLTDAVLEIYESLRNKSCKVSCDCQMVHTSHVVDVSDPSAPNRSSNVAIQPLGHKNSSLQCRKPYFLWWVKFWSEIGQQNWWISLRSRDFFENSKLWKFSNQFDRAFFSKRTLEW